VHDEKQSKVAAIPTGLRIASPIAISSFKCLPASRNAWRGAASYVELAEAIVNWLAEIPVAFCSITRRILRGRSQGLAPVRLFNVPLKGVKRELLFVAIGQYVNQHDGHGEEH
jgi:hypothetical protein